MADPHFKSDPPEVQAFFSPSAKSAPPDHCLRAAIRRLRELCEDLEQILAASFVLTDPHNNGETRLVHAKRVRRVLRKLRRLEREMRGQAERSQRSRSAFADENGGKIDKAEPAIRICAQKPSGCPDAVCVNPELLARLMGCDAQLAAT